MEQFIGSFVSLDCGDNGVFQGQIAHIDGVSQNITLQKVFCNGSPSSNKHVLITARTIKNLEIINAPEENASSSVIKIKKPIPKRASSHSSNHTEGFHIKDFTKKPSEERAVNYSEGMRTPNKKEKQRQQRFLERDEAAFGLAMDASMKADFDFEKNLSLFNKKAVYDEINASKPDVVRQTDKKNSNYRCDENVLSSKPTALRQIIVPFSSDTEYVTDSGLIIPCISQDIRNRLLNAAEKHGLTLERQAELMGRAASEIALLLLGGAHRLNPHNQHQCPSVALLCGPHRAGSFALNCARHLASHGVRTTVFIENQVTLPTEMIYELALYKLTCSKVTTTVQDLSTAPVDLIILALTDTNTSINLAPSPVARWANQNKAQVLAIEPPPQGTPGVTAKYSLVSALPLAHSQANGKIHLCNLGIPLQIYRDMGITYCSPFGPKFFVPLHPNDS